MATSKQLSITRTAGEWEIIKSKFNPNKPELAELSLFIKREVLKIKNKLSEMPDEVLAIGGVKIIKRPSLPFHIFDDIKLIAIKMGVQESTVIDRLIMSSLIEKKGKDEKK